IFPLTHIRSSLFTNSSLFSFTGNHRSHNKPPIEQPVSHRSPPPLHPAATAFRSDEFEDRVLSSPNSPFLCSPVSPPLSSPLLTFLLRRR
ncbi:hypothetical protein S245_015445, partial [Arachis hypogaea]